jgi:hypothetical protein
MRCLIPDPLMFLIVEMPHRRRDHQTIESRLRALVPGAVRSINSGDAQSVLHDGFGAYAT